jgi:chorismate--pyruvate lyase
MKQKKAESLITFPVTLTAQWQAPNIELISSFPKTLVHWLLDEGSLTSRLKAHSNTFRVQLIGEKKQICTADEACSQIVAGEPILVREVILYCDDVPQVFARSLLPLASLTGKEKQLENLGTQSLGQVIFNNPSLQRQRLEISSFSSNSSVVKLAKMLVNDTADENALVMTEHELWGRRSIFMLDNKPLMVAEVFLPNAFAYRVCDEENKTLRSEI